MRDRIPKSVTDRLALPVDYYKTLKDETINVALVVPKPGMMSHLLVPVALYDRRAKQSRPESMEHFALSFLTSRLVVREYPSL